MPKEISHWLLAEETARRLPDGLIRESIEAYPDLYQLGAVVFDSAFYAVRYPKAAEASEAGLRLHGINGEDTYEPLKRLLASELAEDPAYEGPRGGEDASTLSFIAGCVTHIMGDTHFHPLVNFFSGKYYADDRAQMDRSQKRHRRFEAALDRHFLSVSGIELRNGGSLSRTLAASTAAVGDRLEDLAAGLYYGSGGPSRPAMIPLLRRHATIQKLFGSPIAASVARAIGALLGGGAAGVAAAFYTSDPPEGYALFRGPIEYRHPNTGEERRESVGELFDRAASAGTAVLGTLAEWAQSMDAAADPFGGHRGVSLEVGCDFREYPALTHTDTSTPMDELLGVAGPPV
ncbi:MAG: zinc dependent phospholipase C family protein [Deltaproteobacteria bacterium]|nr:zinc dependent phospholipase C family protein [Deltaproteobacteria bacterium]